jgi:hypothetical protein
MEEKVIDEALLEAYISMWNNRKILKGGNPADVLEELIRRELLDENSHPRARKSISEKFYLCIKRVSESLLSDREKIAIISVYVVEMEKLSASK